MLTEHAHALVDQLARVLELIGVAVIIGSIIGNSSTVVPTPTLH
jgi:hypothetical protein